MMIEFLQSRGRCAAIMLLIVALSASGAVHSATEHSDSQSGDGASDCAPRKCGLVLYATDQGVISAPLLETALVSRLTSLINRTEIKQSFRNTSSEWVEGIYTFPLPDNASVSELVMTVGERRIVGEMHERTAAKKRYEKAKSSGRKASLVTAARPNVFTTNIANIAPGETIAIELVFHQRVSLDEAGYELRLPLVVGPRYQPFSEPGHTPPADAGETPGGLTNPVLASPVSDHNPVSIVVDINLGVSLANIISPYHRISTQQTGDTRYRVSLANHEVPANRDFVLRFKPNETAAPSGHYLSETIGEYSYGLVTLHPPHAELSKRLSRSVVFIIDTSGSMAGTSIQQATEALYFAAGRLSKADRFNIIQFNSYTTALFENAVLATRENLDVARQYIRGLGASGGTEMLPALERAFANEVSDEHVAQVIFITDGNVSNETQLYELIESRLGNRRLFTVGIGSAPNQYFMRQAARAGRGSFTFIGDHKEVEQQMLGLFEKLERPMMREIQIAGLDGDSVEVFPEQLNDLYHGEPLSLVFRSKRLPETLQVIGKLPDRHWRATVELSGGQGRQGIAYVWARSKIDALMAAYRTDKKPLIRQQIIDTAIAHRVVTKFTALVAVDQRINADAKAGAVSRRVPSNLPHGWKFEKVFGTLPQTATNAPIYLLVGLSLMIAAGFACWHSVRHRHAR